MQKPVPEASSDRAGGAACESNLTNLKSAAAVQVQVAAPLLAVPTAGQHPLPSQPPRNGRRPTPRPRPRRRHRGEHLSLSHRGQLRRRLALPPRCVPRGRSGHCSSCRAAAGRRRLDALGPVRRAGVRRQPLAVAGRAARLVARGPPRPQRRHRVPRGRRALRAVEADGRRQRQLGLAHAGRLRLDHSRRR